MTQQEIIDKARSVVDEIEGNSYVIAPTQHAEKVNSAAPALAAVLRRSDVKAAAQEYEQKDADANQARREFMAAANYANASILVAGVCSTLLVVLGAFFPTLPSVSGAAADSARVAAKDAGMPAAVLPAPSAPASPWLAWLVFGSLAFVMVVTGYFGLGWMTALGKRNLLESFKRWRTEAEVARGQYFKLVTDLEPPADATADPSGIPLGLLQLEYFRRYQLDVQLEFFTRRGKDHEQEADRMVNLSIWSGVAASFLSAVAGVLGAAVSPRLAVIAALGAIATAVSVYAATRESIQQARSNADRYKQAAQACASS